MNTLEPAVKQSQTVHLLDTIRAFWMDVGNALSDSELTFYLRDAQLPPEEGFAFLGFADGNVVFSVPKQNPGDWYSTKNWVAPVKENIARAIAKKHHLSLYQPLDGPFNFYPKSSLGIGHHHLELTDQRQTVIVVHPLFLKVRLFGKCLDHIYGRNPDFPLPLGPDLLQDLSHLYHDGPAVVE
jgi:hypothetical protein